MRLIYIAGIGAELIESIIMLVWMWVPIMSSVTAGILNLNHLMKLQKVNWVKSGGGLKNLAFCSS